MKAVPAVKNGMARLHGPRKRGERKRTDTRRRGLKRQSIGKDAAEQWGKNTGFGEGPTCFNLSSGTSSAAV